MIRLPTCGAGKYYANSAAVLQQDIADCVANPAPPLLLPSHHAARSPTAHDVEGLRGLIVPHGATQDSGRAAGAAYAVLQAALARRPRPLRALLLGTNHFILQPPACLSTAHAWRTPLGDVPVDQELNTQLHQGGIPYDDAPHRVEHSIENQLPFLQVVASAAAATATAATGGQPTAAPPCSIAPISVGWLGCVEEVEGLADVLAGVLRQHPPGSVVLIATSDFTHAGPSYGETVAAPWMSLREHCIWRDSPLLHAIVSDTHQGLLRACTTTGTSLCGRWPVATLMRVAQVLHWDLQLLTYAPSDLYVRSRDINGFASFATWSST